MKSLKRIISALLCMSLLFGCCLVQAEETVTETVYGTENVELINALGIAEYKESELGDNISRIEFYTLLCKVAGYPPVENWNTVFSDLAPAQEGEKYAKVLHKLGLISHDKNGRIYPDGNIPPAEAAALFVKVLGYTAMAEAKGGYPAGYLSVANSIDVTEGLDMSAPALTKGMAIDMSVNALEANVMTQTVRPDGTSEYKAEKELNLFESAHGIYIVEGVVNGVDISRISGVSNVRPFHIEVDETRINVELIFEDDLTKAYDYLGYDVKAYVTDKAPYGIMALYIDKTDSNREYVFDTEDVIKVDSTSLKAYDLSGKKTKNYRFKKAVPLIYNGVSTKSAFTGDVIAGKTGTVKLVDNNDDGTADVVFADVYKNIVVSYVDMEKLVAYDKINPAEKANIDNEADDPFVILYDLEGKEIYPTDVKEGNVLSVYDSASDARQAFSKIYVSSETETGEIESVQDKDEIVVNGTTYELTAECLEKCSNFVKPGSDVVLHIDAKGMVAYIEGAKPAETLIGFIVAADTESGMDSRLKFKICIAPEEYIEAYSAKNIKIDGVRYKNTDSEVYEHLNVAAKVMFPTINDSDVKNSIVRFALNSEGEIIFVDTLLDGNKEVAHRYSEHTNENCLFTSHVDSGYHRKSGQHITVDGNIVLNNNSMLFAYPDISDTTVSVFDEDMYSLNTFTKEVPSSVKVNDLWAFYTSRNQVISEFTAQPYSKKNVGGSDEDDYIAVVSRKTTILDPNDDNVAVTNLVLMTKDGEVNVPVKGTVQFDGLAVPAEGEEAKDPDLVGTTVSANPAPGTVTKLTADDLKQGDIIVYATDYKGYLANVTLYYRASTDTVVTQTGYGGALTSQFTWHRGYVFDSFPEGFFFYANSELTGDIDTDREILKNVKAEDCQFVYYTTYANCKSAGIDFSEHSEELRVGSLSMADLKSYMETGDDCTFGILQRYYTYPRMFVAIEGLNE